MTQLWLLYAILAPILLAIVNILNKVLISKYDLKPSVLTFLFGVSGIIPAVIIVFILKKVDYSFDIIFLSGISGILNLLFLFLLFKALEKSDAPIVSALLVVGSLSSVLWGYLFFHESLTSTQYLGILIVIFCTAFLNIEASVTSSNHPIEISKISVKRRLSLSKTLLLVLPASFLSSLAATIEKYLTNLTSVYSVFFWEQMIAFLFIIILFFILHEKCINTIKIVRVKISVIAAIGMLRFLALLCLLTALSFGPLSLVMVIVSTTPVFVILFIYVIDMIRPGSIPDLASRQRLLRRVLIITATIPGVYLLI